MFTDEKTHLITGQTWEGARDISDERAGLIKNI